MLSFLPNEVCFRPVCMVPVFYEKNTDIYTITQQTYILKNVSWLRQNFLTQQ